jgi:hypothetical protein
MDVLRRLRGRLSAALLLTLIAVAATALVVAQPWRGATASATVAVSDPLAAAPLGALALTGPRYVLLGANDLGMHCMQQSYADFMILPPYNNLKVQLFRRGSEGATLIKSGVTITFSVIGNTTSASKIDFWKYAADYGFTLQPDVGLTGNGLKGTLKLSADGNYFEATGIPLTPYGDSGVMNPYQVAKVVARSSSTGALLATQRIVLPVSTEMRCDLCHGKTQTGESILQAHDKRSGTSLLADLRAGKRHACSECHRDNALGAPGDPSVAPLSQAMHLFHSSKMGLTTLKNKCYSCHPGITTKCLRGAMAKHGITCTNAKCHGSVYRVGQSQVNGRQAWLQEPRCGSCHGSKFAPNKSTLYRDSYLKNGPESMNGFIMCESCHNSPHAEWPSMKAVDNALPLRVQGLPTFIKRCTACHGGESGRIHGNTGG